MKNILMNQKGMNIIGQGGKIILFTLPSLIAAIVVQDSFPQIAALPRSIDFIRPLGYVLLFPGLLLWGAAVIQLIIGFYQGKLITTGAYGIVRNPIYSSATFFILPAVALLTLTWIYLLVSVFLYVGVMIFIGEEEKQLGSTFGRVYEDYMAKVDRMVPFGNFGFGQTHLPAGAERREMRIARKSLLVCGILAPLIYVGSDILAAMSWESYSYIDQSVSELRAIAAPTRPFLVPVLIVYSLLEITFGWVIKNAPGYKRGLHIAGILLIGLGILDLIAPFFPMHLRGTGETLTDTLHKTLTAVTVLLILTIIGFGSGAGGRWFRRYSILTIGALVLFGAWAGFETSRIEAGLPTPWVGVKERINIYGYMLWMLVLAIALLRAQDSAAPENFTGNK